MTSDPNGLSGLRVDDVRLWSSLMAMAEIGATPGGGSNRLALSDEDRRARALLAKWCAEAGATLRVDPIGNMFARRDGTDGSEPPVLVGSHLDTQPMGGRFDGVLGVLAALEILRTLDDADVTTGRPIELVNWTNEEGARFAPAMLGSSVFAGLKDLESALALADRDGATVAAELKRIGHAGEAALGESIAAYFELHIEQGPVLEDAGIPVGVVTHAQGVRWFDVFVDGAAGHAGTTPMDRRRDALVGAAAIIAGVRDLAATHPPAVATVGTVAVSPGSRNVIPGRVTLSVDLRHPDAALLESLARELPNLAADLASHCEVRVEEVLAFDPTTFDVGCVEAVRNAAATCGLVYRDIVSGGGHDACNIARIAPAAMVFVPCIGGLSHTEAEAITPEWAEAGANTLLHAVLATANA